MADEFTPEASVDFEALAAAAAEAAGMNGGFTAPPPTAPAPAAPPIRPHAAPATSSRTAAQQLDPFQALEQLVGQQELMFLELGNINKRLTAAQLQAAALFGAGLLLAVIVYKLTRPAG